MNLSIYTYRNEIYYNYLQGVVQLIPQWLAMNGKSKNSIVVQFTGLDVPAGLQFLLES